MLAVAFALVARIGLQPKPARGAYSPNPIYFLMKLGRERQVALRLRTCNYFVSVSSLQMRPPSTQPLRFNALADSSVMVPE